jgi:hypothetical protein
MLIYSLLASTAGARVVGEKTPTTEEMFIEVFAVHKYSR